MTLRIIAGQFKGRLLKTPKGPATRPTQGMLREAVFNICQNEIEGARFLDLFAGSGAMGFEALSRGASHVVLVESHRHAVLCIQKNIEELHVTDSVTLLAINAASALKKLHTPFDLIYIDPPYDSSISPLLEEVIKHNLLKESGVLFVEERYTPQKKPPPQAPLSLSLKNSRRFGTALLHQYVYKKPQPE